MKTGIIIRFHDYEKKLDINYFISQINDSEDLEICLVNNYSKDNTYELLKEISEKCKNVSVVNINKYKTDIYAIRAGVRYLVNHFNLREIGYIDTNLLSPNQNELNNVMKVVINNIDSILKYKNEVIQQKKIKQSMLQSIFSLLECMKEFKEDHHVLCLQE
jgi:hypothetical protein